MTTEHRSPFPVQYISSRPAGYLENHYLLVLHGNGVPVIQPAFIKYEEVCKPQVDKHGTWCSLEWTMIPQLYDPKAPWLGLIPHRVDGAHFTRALIGEDMIKARSRDPNFKSPRIFSLDPDVIEELKPYVTRVVSEARDTIENVSRSNNFVDGSAIVWPNQACERAMSQFQLLRAGVTSKRSFVHALSAMRRPLLELEGFLVWAKANRGPLADAANVTRAYRIQEDCEFRGVFLNGTKREWLDPDSQLRCTYTRVSTWTAPVYALVNGEEWDIQIAHELPLLEPPFDILPGVIDTEKRQLAYWCYPPRVKGSDFERASRGIVDHSEEGQMGEMHTIWAKDIRRDKTRTKQAKANRDAWQIAATDPKWQQVVYSKPPPAFMTFLSVSDIATNTITYDELNAPKQPRSLLPLPSLIWGVKSSERRAKMLETLVLVFKLLILRPVLLAQGFLSTDQAFIKTQEWRDILTRQKSDSPYPAIWRDGNENLWGKLNGDVKQRVEGTAPEPTLSKMNCLMRCWPMTHFDDANDPEGELGHYILFRLAELHILHDFACYHPDLQQKANGDWCPPAFDASVAIHDVPTAFPGVTTEVPPEQQAAMNDIVRVVRWKGDHEQRGWEVEDAGEKGEWLNALRDLISKASGAWKDNRRYDSFRRAYPQFDILTRDFTHIQDRGPCIDSITEVILSTHMLLCLRNGRVPSRWFNSPRLKSLECKDCFKVFRADEEGGA